MRILQLNNRVPFPLNDGGNIGVNYYTKGFLEAGVELSLLAMNSTRHWTEIEKLPSLFSRLKNFDTIKVDNSITVLGAIKSLLHGSSYNIDRFISKEFEIALVHLLQKENFDIVQLESLYLVPYIDTIRKHSKAKITIRQHNIECIIWERLAEKEKNPIKKTYLRYLAKKLKQFELQHINDYDLVLLISKNDEEIYRKLGCTRPLYVHPFGVDISSISFEPGSINPITLYHIGAMDWLPNMEGINWFLQMVMPLVIAQLPNLTLYLAGRNMPQYYFKNKWPNVIVKGEVPDAAAFEKDKTILVVPLQSGGGVRIKIFQAMAMGKCVISTTVGMEGIEAEDNLDVFIADTPALFAQKIIDLVNNPPQIQQTGLAARKLMEEKYDSKRLIKDLLNRYEMLLKDNSTE